MIQLCAFRQANAALQRPLSLAGPAAGNVRSGKPVMPARSSATLCERPRIARAIKHRQADLRDECTVRHDLLENDAVNCPVEISVCARKLDDVFVQVRLQSFNGQRWCVKPNR